MALTLAEAQALRAAALAAYQSALTSAEYTIGNRELVRQKIADLRADFLRWDALVDQLESGAGTGIPIRRIVIRDL